MSKFTVAAIAILGLATFQSEARPERWFKVPKSDYNLVASYVDVVNFLRRSSRYEHNIQIQRAHYQNANGMNYDVNFTTEGSPKTLCRTIFHVAKIPIPDTIPDVVKYYYCRYTDGRKAKKYDYSMGYDSPIKNGMKPEIKKLIDVSIAIINAFKG